MALSRYLSADVRHNWNEYRPCSSSSGKVISCTMKNFVVSKDDWSPNNKVLILRGLHIGQGDQYEASHGKGGLITNWKACPWDDTNSLFLEATVALKWAHRRWPYLEADLFYRLRGDGLLASLPMTLSVSPHLVYAVPVIVPPLG